MSILKAALVTFANSALEESIGTDGLDEAIKLCLADLSEANLLGCTDTEATALESGDAFKEYPTGLKSVKNVLIKEDGADSYNEPLIKIGGGLKEYRQLLAETTANGTPTHFSESEKNIVFWKIADQDYTLAIEYYKYHASDADNIEFGDEFLNALKFGATYYYAIMKARERYIKIYGPMYFEQKEIRRLNSRKQPYITR